MRHFLRTAAVTTAVALALSACGGDDTDDMAGMGSMDMGGMSMNEPDAPRADEVDGAELREAPFIRFEDAPAEFSDASGTAYVAFTDMTFVTLELTGLPEGVEVISHLHAQPCAADGGPHFRFDQAGADVPPNEVHLAGTPDADGTLTLKVTNDQAATEAMAVVFHPRSDTTQYVACADVPPTS